MARRPKRKPPRGRSRLRKGLSIIPSLFTIGNIFCGYYSLIATLNGRWDQAALAIAFGAVMDGLDGRIARLTKTTSEFGVQLDSLADVLTFGVAPALLAYNWGFGSISGIHGEIAENVRQGVWLASFIFVICGTLRLARFNVQAQKPPEAAAKRYFVGLPIPAGAGVVVAIVHCFPFPLSVVGTSLLWSLLILITAGLMVSTVRYYSFKELNLMKHGPRVTLVAMAILLTLIFFYSKVMLLLIAVAYASSGPITKLSQVVRRLLTYKTAPAHPAHENLKP